MLKTSETFTVMTMWGGEEDANERSNHLLSGNTLQSGARPQVTGVPERDKEKKDPAGVRLSGGIA